MFKPSYKIVKVTMGDGSNTFYIKKKYFGFLWLYCIVDIGLTRYNYVKVEFPEKEDCDKWIAKKLRKVVKKKEYIYIE